MKYLSFLFLTFLLFACSSEKEEVKEVAQVHFEDIQTIFSPGEFSDTTKIQLLKELNICETRINPNDTAWTYAPCAPSNFRFLSFNEKKELKNSFMLQIKALSILPASKGVPLPVRHLMIFERESGKLIKVNGFRGNLVGWRKGKNPEKDLLVRFYLPVDEVFANCTFTWNGGRYEFSNAISVDWGEGDRTIKVEDRDSVSNLIYTDLINSSLLF